MCPFCFVKRPEVKHSSGEALLWWFDSTLPGSKRTERTEMNYQSKRYEELGQQIVNDLFPQLLNIRIAWLSSDKEKKNNGKIVFAECSKVSANYDWCCDYDFIITVYEPNVGKFTEAQMKILLEHELMHIGVEEERKYIVPHDAEEFIEIIRKYGIDWSEPKNGKRS